MGQPWVLQSTQLWATFSWKSLKSKPSALPHTHLGCGTGIWMTALLFKRWSTGCNFNKISTPYTHTYSSLQRTPTPMGPYHSRTLKLPLDLITIYSQQYTGNPHVQTNISINTLTHRARTVCTTPQSLHKEQAHIQEALQGCGFLNWASTDLT